MKRFTLSLSLVVLTAAFFSMNSTASAQPPAENVPHRVGVVDMGHIFKNYKRLTDMMNSLKTEVTKTDQQAQAMVAAMQQKKEQLKQLKQGTPAYTTLESQLLQDKNAFDTFRQVAQLDFARKEVQIYREVYLEVTQAVEKYAAYYKYTLVIRFSRDEVSDTDNPKEVVNRIASQQIIYHRAEDDITGSILDYLNRKYVPAPGTPAAPATTTPKAPTGN